MFIVIAQGVLNRRRRGKRSKFLLACADRVQGSVFEADLDEAGIAEAWLGARTFIEPREDNLRLYSMCPRCAAARRVTGAKPPVSQIDRMVVR